MLIIKNSSRMIALGLMLAFIAPRPIPCDIEYIAKFTDQAAPVVAQENEKWEDFDYKEVSSPKEWYGEINHTFKKTSSTGKGPLWARVATSIKVTENRSGDPMCGVKWKL
jgi:hypothetical protein